MKKIELKLNKREEEMFCDTSALLYVSKEVYNARKEVNLSQKELADLVGTTQRIISNIENAEINIGFNLLLRIARALNLNLIFGGCSFSSHATKGVVGYKIMKKVAIKES